MVLPNLRNIREHPPSLSVSVGFEIVDPLNLQSSYNTSNNERDTDINADNIDWDISVESSQVDWDIGTIEETEDTGNGLGPYEIVNASEILQSSSPNEVEESDPFPSNKGVDDLRPDISASEISWDISVETPQVDVIDDVNVPNDGSENQTYVTDNLCQTTETKEERSQLLETDYRNKILDDLFEVISLCLIQCFLFFTFILILLLEDY